MESIVLEKNNRERIKDQEQNEHSHCQQERENTQAKKELQEKEDEIRNSERAKEETVEKNEDEIKVCRQEVKQLRNTQKDVSEKKMVTTPPTMSLLKFDTPQLVTKKDKKTSLKTLKPDIFSQISPSATSKRPSADAIREQTQNILNVILPPRQWIENNQLLVQQVSAAPCSQTDVIHLQEELDLKLHQRQAKEMGICPIRREFYTQCFDELVRQITIICAERGVLLAQVRDEIRMTIAAYETLYQSSVAFGIKKELEAKHWRSNMENKIGNLENKKAELERQLNEEKAKCEETERDESKRLEDRANQYAEEIQFLNDTFEKLKDQLNTNVKQIIIIARKRKEMVSPDSSMIHV